MKVIGISLHNDDNTSIIINEVLKELEKEGIETEIIQMESDKVERLIRCSAHINRRKKNTNTKELFNTNKEIIRKSKYMNRKGPHYFADLTVEQKALLEYAGMVGKRDDMILRRKIGGAVAGGSRGIIIHTIMRVNSFFDIEEMIVLGSIYWDRGWISDNGMLDKEELANVRFLGKGIASLVKKPRLAF